MSVDKMIGAVGPYAAVAVALLIGLIAFGAYFH